MTSGEPVLRQWWTISGDELMGLLRKVQAGQDPELVYAEAYANSTVELLSGEGEGQ